LIQEPTIMTTKSAAAITLPSSVILFGLDDREKPIAATFPGRLCDLAIKAARQLKLNVLRVTRDEVAELARRLPQGRINSTGKGLVPTVKPALYDQVLKMAEADDGSPASAPPNTGAKTGTGSPKVPMNEAGKDGNPAGGDGLPASWKDIAAGHLVLVQESRVQGWAEALVVERRGEILQVRWQDYRHPPFPVHVDAVALLNPSPSFKTK
jgi:hypothetical protein